MPDSRFSIYSDGDYFGINTIPNLIKIQLGGIGKGYREVEILK